MNPVSGGPAQGLRNNIPFWKKYGVEPFVLCLDSPVSSFADADNIIAIGSGNNAWSYSANLAPWLEENLTNYDCVLVHGLWQYHGFALNKALNKLRKMGKKLPQVYVMAHGMLDPYFQKAKERRFKAIRNIIYWHLIEKHLINKADGILFTCQEELELAATSFSGYKPKAVYNIGYGIIAPPPFNIQHKQAFELLCPNSRGKDFLLFISRIHPKKGVDLLINAYKILLKSNTESKLPFLVIAGPGLETDYGKMLLKLVQEDEQLKERIFFNGMLVGDAKWGAFYGCEALVLPSHQENFGIVVAEALGCSKPVLTTNKVNIWREIIKGNCGIVNNDDLDGTISSLKIWQAMLEQEKVEFRNNALAIFHNEFTAEATSRNSVNVMLKNNIN